MKISTISGPSASIHSFFPHPSALPFAAHSSSGYNRMKDRASVPGSKGSEVRCDVRAPTEGRMNRGALSPAKPHLM